MKKKSLGLNAILNGFRNVINIIFPLITFPYVSRILGVVNLGVYNFALSVNNYFILISTLGIATYAIREGAKYRDSREQMSRFSSEVFTINLFSTIIAYFLLIISLLALPKLQGYSVVILIFSVQIFFTTIGVDWIYSIYEEYKYITIRSIVFKLISIFLLFTFVKKEEDYILYAAITVLATVGSNLFNFFYVKKYCDIHIVYKFEWKKHIAPIMIIFASNIAIMIYVNSDITMLGFMKGDYSVGTYSVAIKIYNLVKNLIAAILIVAIPRLSMLWGQKNIEEYKNTLIKIFNMIVLIMFPTVVGLFCLSRKVVLLIAGKEYIESTGSLRLLSIALAFSIFSWLFSQCILLPSKREKIVLIVTIVSAIINIILNCILIPVWEEKGAAFSTIIAELIMAVGCGYYSIKIVRIKNIWSNIISTFAGCVAIVLICILINSLKFSLYVSVGLSVCISAIVYVVVLILLHNEILIKITRTMFRKFDF